MRPTVVLTTMDHLDVTQRCVESMDEHTFNSHDLVVVDASSDSSTVDYIQEVRPDATILELGSRYWIAYAWNRGIETAVETYNPEVICILNNDLLFEDYWLSYLCNSFYVDTPWPVGMVGPLLLYPTREMYPKFKWGKPGEVQSPLIDHLYKGSIVPVKQMLGACMAISRNTLGTLGYFDERYIGNHDEMEFCQRLWVKGHSVLCNLRSKVYHLHGTVRREKSLNDLYKDTVAEYGLDYPHPTELWIASSKRHSRDAFNNYKRVLDWWMKRWV